MLTDTTTTDPCPDCHGLGSERNGGRHRCACRFCDGAGKLPRVEGVPGCYGCDGTGRSLWSQDRGSDCVCRLCSECGEHQPIAPKTLDIDSSGHAYKPCVACLASIEPAS